MYVLEFHEIKKEDVLTAGGKGANLGEMTAAGISVPAGFVVTADAYRLFLSENGFAEIFANGLKEAGNDESKLLLQAEKFRSLIQNGTLPDIVEKAIREKYFSMQEAEKNSVLRVAVRSSATAEDLPDASFAGQQETYLNIQGIDDVLRKIRDCYASLWGNRAVCYRQNQGYDQLNVALAVVIQQMVESEKAGVLFTANPVNRRMDEMQINASWGLGESVVSGRVTADSCICSKDGKIKSYTPGTKKTQIIYAEKGTKEIAVSRNLQDIPCLSDTELKSLCREGVRIEQHYQSPMDIEWAIRRGKVYILQARAITTLGSGNRDSQAEEEAKLIQEYIKDSKISGVMKENMSFQLEKMPYAYRPLDYDFIMKINTQKARIFQENGIIITSDPQIDDDGIMTLPDPSKKINGKVLKLFGTIKLLRNFEACARACREFMPKHEAEIEKIKKMVFSEKSVSECGEFLKYAYEFTGTLCYDRFKYALFPSALGNDLTKAVRKIDKNYTNYDLYWELDNKTAVITREIAQLAGKIRQNKELKTAMLAGKSYRALCDGFPDFAEKTNTFLERNGYKSDFNCYCVEAKTLKEDPDRLVNILRPLVAEPSPQTAFAAKGNSEAEKNPAPTANASAKNISGKGIPEEKDFSKLMGQLKEIYGDKFPALEQKINNFRYFHIVREESQYLWETLFYYVRRCLERLNLLLLGNTDYVHGIANLFANELFDACSRGFLSDTDKEKIARRNAKHPLSQKVWDASKLLVFDTNGDVLKGTSGSNGVFVGKACVIKSPAEFYKMQKGDILVCEYTDPEWTPLFKLAGAVVADTGAALSHAAIVAREFGIPAVLGVGYATVKYKDGDTIRVDGDKGEVSAC